MLSCYICHQKVEKSEHAQHERVCLAQIQICDNFEYTRGTGTANIQHSKSMTDLTATNDNKSRKCYICGKLIPSYSAKNHERICSEKWQRTTTKPPSRHMSIGDLSVSPKSISPMKLRSTSVYDIGSRDVLSTPTSSRTRRATAYKYPATEMNKSISTYSVGVNKKVEKNESPSPKKWISKSLTNLSKDLIQMDSRKKSTPQYIACSICARHYSIHSISIHEKKCRFTETGANKVAKAATKPEVSEARAVPQTRTKSTSNESQLSISPVDSLDSGASTMDSDDENNNAVANSVLGGLSINHMLTTTDEKDWII